MAATVPHYCNEPLRCPHCIRRFWAWAQGWTRGRPPKAGEAAPNFYEAAAKFQDVDHRSRRPR